MVYMYDHPGVSRLEIASGGATSISDDGITKRGPMRAAMWSVHLWQECWDNFSYGLLNGA